MYMYFLRCCTDVITWGLIILLDILLVAIGGGLYYYAGVKQQEYADAEKSSGANLSSQSTYYVDVLTYLSYAMWVGAVIYACAILCLCHKIRLVTAIIESTARYVQDCFSILAVPVVNMLIALFFMVIWIIGTVFLYSVGDPIKRDDYPIADIQWSEETRYMWYFNLFAILWIVAFFVSSGDFIIGASACIWYFNQVPAGASKREKKEHRTTYSINPVCTAIYWLYRYHLGSIALGAFMLAVVWAIRLIMAYIYAKLKETGATKNQLVKYVMYVIQCFLQCFERFIRFVNKQAFIYIGLTGKNFCESMLNAFQVVIRHPIEFALLAGLGHFFMYVGMASIILGSMGVGYAMMVFIPTIADQITSPFAPLVIIGVLTYPVADLCLDVYMVACYAVLHCYYVDCRLQESKGGGPKNAPPELANFLIRDETDSDYVSVSDSYDSVEEAKKQRKSRKEANSKSKGYK